MSFVVWTELIKFKRSILVAIPNIIFFLSSFPFAWTVRIVFSVIGCLSGILKRTKTE